MSLQLGRIPEGRERTVNQSINNRRTRGDSKQRKSKPMYAGGMDTEITDLWTRLNNGDGMKGKYTDKLESGGSRSGSPATLYLIFPPAVSYPLQCCL